ncbi:putative bifunctional diguanylate cyclase/phosphodiesterase [Isoalcanivorax indicus]|uniref:putative bifunctional diguanylate cyclase/phosphodiesterase n=1 Tax=Isoalcanivorax indicus TaxID=2202653 RepID=UPI0013C44FF1|nr:EAL domain-containing protein [Isoalcanivorax indicus]
MARRLADQEDFSRLLQDTADIVVLIQDAQGRLLSVNRYGRWLCGLPATRLRRRAFASLLEDPPATLVTELARVAAGTQHACRHESALRRPGGDTLLLSWWHTLWRSGAGGKSRVVSIGLDISDQRIAEAHIGWLASHDPLTGLFNRRRFLEEGRRWQQAVLAGERTGFALMLLDLDQFRDINDLGGHHHGDRLLQQVAQALRADLRQSDVIARLGGDEFGILLDTTRMSRIRDTAERCCNALASLTVTHSIGRGLTRLPVTTSIGISRFPQHGDTIEALLANADIAMYQAKSIGRNAWCLFDGDDLHRARIHERVFWEQHVRDLIAGEPLTLHGQPIVNVTTGKTSHHEALLRVSDGHGGWLPTQNLINAAEQGGMIQQLDERVIDQACRLIGSSATPASTLAVNLSGLSFHNPDLVEHVRQAMLRHGVAPGALIFEITETAALTDIDNTVKVMEALRAQGCRFALDDFGVGFSSLYYLKKLPVDFVKIDGSFIRHLEDNAEHRVLIRALVDVARAFRLLTVAECVEDAAVLAMLAELGVDYAQGYHLGRPAPLRRGPAPTPPPTG